MKKYYTATIPPVRRLLGDQPVPNLRIPSSLERESLQLAVLFPESSIQLVENGVPLFPFIDFEKLASDTQRLPDSPKD